jgi:hypothetical protein
MTFLVALLVWIVVLGICFALATYALRQLPMAEPFRGIAIAVLCLIAIVIILGFVTGQVPMLGYVRAR